MATKQREAFWCSPYETLGVNNYKSYLKSNLWNEIRDRCLEPRCEICSRVANHLHHMDYDIETLKGEKPWNLVSLCKRCHENVHLDDNGKKLPLWKCFKKTREILNESETWTERIERLNHKSSLIEPLSVDLDNIQVSFARKKFSKLKPKKQTKAEAKRVARNKRRRLARKKIRSLSQLSSLIIEIATCCSQWVESFCWPVATAATSIAAIAPISHTVTLESTRTSIRPQEWQRGKRPLKLK